MGYDGVQLPAVILQGELALHSVTMLAEANGWKQPLTKDQPRCSHPTPYLIPTVSPFHSQGQSTALALNDTEITEILQLLCHFLNCVIQLYNPSKPLLILFAAVF